MFYFKDYLNKINTQTIEIIPENNNKSASFLDPRAWINEAIINTLYMLGFPLASTFLIVRDLSLII